ncbi:IS4 family transposase [Paenibacillus sp. alder61]|uniref:IS4 family transposase n=1 Tax=Paenibacillus sp. alder61 TaxID=2862948 RepID=UPI001CD3F565|nr:IS4 family transposase [Paenibacillus sp. alder61]MCA1296695.1 IS4 family transposase [Paenibacillus sp. alder61]
MNTKIPNPSVIRQALGWLDINMRLLCGDHYAKKLCFGNTILLFLEAILQKRSSLDDIAEHLRSAPWLQKWVGLESIHASSLNRKLARIPTDSVRNLFLQRLKNLWHHQGPTLPKKLKRLGRLAAVDSSSITLSLLRGKWAFRQTGESAVKMHTCLHLTGEISAWLKGIVLSTAMVADLDSEVLEHLVWEPGTTYLFDRGYICYGQFLHWDRNQIYFVVRLKSNSKVRVLQSKVAGSFIKRDAEVEIKDPDSQQTGVFRLVEFEFIDNKHKVHQVRVLTNRWDVKAEDVARMYHYRWKVELFFKFMKSNLHLKKIYNNKPQAVWNLIYLNLLAYVVCEEIRYLYAPDLSIGQVTRKMRAYLTNAWTDFLDRLHPVTQRTSKGRRKKGGRPRIHPERLKKLRMIYY